MKSQTQNISAYIITLEPKDIDQLSNVEAYNKLEDSLKTHYIHRINIPVTHHETFYESEMGKLLMKYKDSKTVIRYYTVGTPKGTNQEPPLYFFTLSY